jgi:hypothetical protein
VQCFDAVITVRLERSIRTQERVLCNVLGVFARPGQTHRTGVDTGLVGIDEFGEAGIEFIEEQGLDPVIDR